jgi:probable F420-dependent oxidoreductase
MQVGVLYPQNELAGDPEAIRNFALAAEKLGYRHLLAYDHVVGAEHADRDPALWGPYSELDPFHDPFVMFGYLAGITSRIEFGTDVLILPQRQTVLVAKQAAELDLLTGGRLRLGVGVGRNWMEYEALNEDFTNRGARIEEQIEVLRRLWSGKSVDYNGRFHNLQGVNIVPPPVQRPIPIWFGGSSDAVVKRAARLGDGWMPIIAPDAQAQQKLAILREEISSHGRDPAKFGIEGWLRMHDADPQRWAIPADGWRRVGADFVMLYPMYRIAKFEDQIETLRRFKEVASG